MLRLTRCANNPDERFTRMVSKMTSMTCSAPKDWVDHFRRAASLEGVTFADFVLSACLDRSASIQSTTAEELKKTLSTKRRPGRIKKEREPCGSN